MNTGPCGCCDTGQTETSAVSAEEFFSEFRKPFTAGRRKFVLACAGAAATVSGISSASATQTAYGNGTEGPMLTVNGIQLPRDVVFRFLPVLMPITTLRINSLYGLRTDPINGYSSMHTGVDFQGVIGTPVYATAAGRVITANATNNGYGNMVEVAHGLGFSTRYAHLSAFSVVPGQIVDRHQLVGLVGETGRITGPHLHFEIRRAGNPMDPITFLIKAHELYQHLG